MNGTNYGQVNPKALAESIARAQADYMTKVYAWMFGGLLATALTAYFAYSTNFDLVIAASPLFIGIIILQFVVVIALSGWIEKMSQTIAGASFLGYSILTGLTFSILLRVYTSQSIYSAFFVTAGMFAATSAFGYFTKKDLTGMGQFMIMGLFGIILATIANFFIMSGALDFVISVIGVIVFAGLTAYDTKRIKEMYLLELESGELAAKAAIVGALHLYLDFINMFLFILRLIGGRR